MISQYCGDDPFQRPSTKDLIPLASNGSALTSPSPKDPIHGSLDGLLFGPSSFKVPLFLLSLFPHTRAHPRLTLQPSMFPLVGFEKIFHTNSTSFRQSHLSLNSKVLSVSRLSAVGLPSCGNRQVSAFPKPSEQQTFFNTEKLHSTT